MIILDILRAGIGFFYVLFIPGFVASWAFFPKKTDVEGIERIGLSFGLSLAFSILPVMFLNFWPGIPVSAISVFVIVFLVTIFFGIIALYRTGVWRKLFNGNF